MTNGLAEWFAAETANLPKLRPDGWAVMGFPIWGEKYWGRFERYCLASMLAPENYAAVIDGAALVIWTQERARRHVEVLMAPYDIEWALRVIPDSLLTSVGSKYQILAIVERLLIRTAAKNGRGYTGVFPDFIMSQGYFASLKYLARHHPAVAHSNLTATVSPKVEECLKPFRRIEGSLVVPARDLGDMGFRLRHPIKPPEVRDEKRPPACHYLWWRGHDYAEIHSAHCNAAWMSPDLCRRAPRDDNNAMAGFTVDAAIPFFLGPKVYHPDLADEMVITDLYDTEMPERPQVPLDRWAQIFRSAAFNSPKYVPMFKGASMVPLHPRADGLSDNEIERQVGVLLKEIESASKRGLA